MKTLSPVLVTGSHGFVGTRLCAELRRRGHRVRGFDLAATGSDFGDVRSRMALEEAMPEGALVFHLASVVGVSRVLREPQATWTTAVDGTQFVCELARRRHARVVLASSSEVYGEGLGRCLREDAALPSSYGPWPRASYPEGKRAAEEILRGFVARGGDGRIARLFNVSGPGQSASGGMVLPTFVECALRGQALPIIGDGSDLRCFQHVEDVVRGLIAVMAAPRACGYVRSRVSSGHVFNLGGSQAISMRCLALRVLDVLGREGRLRSVSSRQRYGGESRRCRARVPDCSLAREALGHRARRSLENIIEDLASSLKETLGAEACVASRVAPSS